MRETAAMDQIDALFDLPPEEFTAARNDLAKRLRAEGDRERASVVSGLRRPTVAAWAVNQVARQDPERIAEVVAAGDALMREQRRALSGVEGADLRGAGARRRDAVEAAVAAAAEHIAAAGSDPATHRDRLLATFEAASVQAPGADAVRHGRLERELAPPTGLEELGGLSLVPDPPSSAGPRDEAEGPDATEEETAASLAADAAASARRRAEEAQEEAAGAHAEVERARIRATDAEQAVRRLRKELQRAEARAHEAAEAVERREVEAAAAQREAEAAEEAAADLAEDARRAAARAGRR